MDLPVNISQPATKPLFFNTFLMEKSGMNTTSDSGLLRLSHELRSWSLELRTKAKELSDASRRARKEAVRARTALHGCFLNAADLFRLEVARTWRMGRS